MTFTPTSIRASISPMTIDAIAIIPKSSGTSSRARITVLTSPIRRSVQRIPMTRSAPFEADTVRVIAGTRIDTTRSTHDAPGNSDRRLPQCRAHDQGTPCKRLSARSTFQLRATRPISGI